MGERSEARNVKSARGGTKQKPLWQGGFSDHILRNDESYGEKWEYVPQNPVREGLLLRADNWAYRGEFVVIDRA